MFCPKCGKGEQMPESYCRQCGEWLPDLAKRGRKSFGGNSPEESLKISLVLSAMTAVTSLALAISLYVKYLGAPDVSGLIYLTAAFLLAMAGWQISNFYVGIKLRRSFVRRRVSDAASRTNELTGNAQPNQALPAADFSRFAPPQPRGSITENTTELLQPVPQQKRKDS